MTHTLSLSQAEIKILLGALATYGSRQTMRAQALIAKLDAVAKATRTVSSIQVGQRLIAWDGRRGYVALTSTSQKRFGPGEAFKIEWLDAHGKSVEDSEYLTLEQLETEGIQRGKGRMAWAH